jgi:hypothetical protein
LAQENMAVTLEALTNSHIGFRAAARDYHLRKYTEGSLRWKELRGCLLLRSGTDINILFYENPICFYNFATGHNIGTLYGVTALWPPSAGKVSSKHCFMSRAQRMFYCEYILQIYVNKEQFTCRQFRLF